MSKRGGRLSRGLYTHRHLAPGGKTMMVAVNRHGERVAEVTINEDADRSVVAPALWDILNQVDPVEADHPPLTVVEGAEGPGYE